MDTTEANSDRPLSMELASGIAAFEAKHFARAAQLLGPVAEQGHADAQYRLAIMHQNGLGLVRDPHLALRWMTAAAEQGHALAQHGLGFMYLHGDCIERNPTEAARWFERGAAQGLAGSQAALAELYAQGEGVPRDPERARQLYRLAGFEA